MMTMMMMMMKNTMTPLRISPPCAMMIFTYLKTGEGEDDDDYFFHEPIRKVYTWLNFFAQPSVVMVVTNIRSVTYAECDEYI